MESTEERNKLHRQELLEQWVKRSGIKPISFHEMPGDASFRRYFRIQTQAESLIAMDAPLPQENCQAYVQIAQALRRMGLQAPDIYAADLKRGFLLITDLGNTTYLKILNKDNVNELYSAALQALAILQSCQQVRGRIIPAFNAEWMWQEWQWHKEWFLNKLLGLQIDQFEKELDSCFSQVVNASVLQPQVFMHRDYHSANLMVLPENQVGILDFQDAFIGPVTYDLVSLLRDCYIDWPSQSVTNWALDYWRMLPEVFTNISQQEFLRGFDFMGIERHLKALFTFSRKHLRDQQSQYLNHIPRTLGYILTVSQTYPELKTLHQFYNEIVCEKVASTCAQ